MPLASPAKNCINPVDTNVLIYVQDARDPVKQAKAVALVKGLPDGVLLWQVANEYLAASRKLVPFGYNHAQAFQDINNWRKVWMTIMPTWAGMDKAENVRQRFNLSFYSDSLPANLFSFLLYLRALANRPPICTMIQF
jgi:predicted nucleic acid-binding protein